MATKMCFQPSAIVFRLLVLYLMHKGNGATMVPATKHERIIDYDLLRNAVFLKSEDILLAGDRILHKLRADLSIMQEPFLCDPSSCENTNKILVVKEDQNSIIICGTRNEGRCESRSVANLFEVSTSGSLPAVSNQTHIPAVALVTKSNTMIIGYTTTDGGKFVYKITEINLATLVSTNTLLLGSEQKYTEIKPLIYFKTALPSILNVNRNYVLIHKKDSWNKYTSQMVIVCGSLNIIIDISCTHDNKKYSLIQDADIFDSGTSAGIIFVGAFVSSDNPRFVSGDSVVCIQKLSQLDPGVISSTCGGVSAAVTLTSLYKLPSSEGYITSIKGDMSPATNIYIIDIGTSAGRLIKTSVTLEGEPLKQFAYAVVQDGASVVAIQSRKNGTETYVVTSKKIAVYLSANCDIYKTCVETVRGNNPLCGWCFFEGRSTTKSVCSSGWISMVGPCSSISVSSGSQRVGESTQLKVSATGFPPNGVQTGDVFQCSILERKSNVIATYNSNMEFTCTIPKITEHQTTSLELVGTRSGKDFLVGKTEYLIYKCDQFKRCGRCIDNRVQCKWCLGICQETGESCTLPTTCPMITDKEIYVPVGVESHATFDVTIPTNYTVACYVKNYNSTFTGIVTSSSVICKLKIPMTNVSATNQNVSVLLKYGPTSASAELDNEINVTVYRCDGLAQDCTHCQALNSSRYHCHWDKSTFACVAGRWINVQCPLPKITKVSPLDSPVGGRTLITINGTDFNNSTPISVTVAGFPCSSVSTTTSGYPEFQEQVIDRVLKVLLNDTIQEAVGARTHATLFERFETTTEYILRNWMALTMYPYLKKIIGSDLHHLVMATQLTMESGPVDAITHDAKFSLREDKLLMQWEPFTQQETSAQSCTKQLTLSVIVNDGKQEYECKVLDCDTITQVKTKCLSQIYVNRPATQLGVHPVELILNWHCGGKTLTLKDEDSSSVKHGNLLRLNTLAHYRIPDGAKMSLVDPATLNQHDYMEINLEFPVQTYNLMHGDNTSTSKWHLVKPMADLDMPRKASTMKDQNNDNISLTKRTIDKYLTTLFDHILDRANCPPPVTFIFDYMDILANKFKIDKNTAWLWKFRIYTVHVWGPMIRQPNQLLDMYLPQYVVDNLGVIAQLLEDGTAESAPTLSEPKIYENEMTKYQTEAKAFINSLYNYNEQPSVLVEYLEDVNKIQLEQRLNKMGYLQKIFDQLIPHLDQIVTELSADNACSNLELDRKMQEVIVLLR